MSVFPNLMRKSLNRKYNCLRTSIFLTLYDSVTQYAKRPLYISKRQPQLLSKKETLVVLAKNTVVPLFSFLVVETTSSIYCLMSAIIQFYLLVFQNTLQNLNCYLQFLNLFVVLSFGLLFRQNCCRSLSFACCFDLMIFCKPVSIRRLPFCAFITHYASCTPYTCVGTSSWCNFPALNGKHTRKMAQCL